MGIIIKTNYYDEILLSCISKLDEFEMASGTEGEAYFVDDNFVIKTFFDGVANIDLFNCYCNEIKNFSNKGFAVPKIYSWCVVPMKNSKRFQCYILEERVPGRNVFHNNIESVYIRCKDFCSREEFENAIHMCNNDTRRELLSEIIRQYILEFMETNEALLNISESNLEKFFESDYYITLNSKYSMSDVLADNIIFDSQKLTLIDNAFIRYKKNKETEDYSKVRMVRDAIDIFEYNCKIRNLSQISPELADNFEQMQEQNKKICFEAMRRFVGKANQMYSPKVVNKYDYSACEYSAKSALGNDLANEICKEIQKEF